MFPSFRAVVARLVARFVEGLPEHPVERSQVSFSETLLLGKPPSGDLLHRLAFPCLGQHRGVERVLKHGAVVDVDEAETPQGASVVRSDPVAAVLNVAFRDAERSAFVRLAVVADAFDVENSEGVSRSVRVRRFEARQAEKHLQVAEHGQVDRSIAVAGRHAHRERDFRKVARPREDREHGKEPALPGRSHATPPEQVARAVARGCDVGGGVEVVEEHGREECDGRRSGCGRV